MVSQVMASPLVLRQTRVNRVPCSCRLAQTGLLGKTWALSRQTQSEASSFDKHNRTFQTHIHVAPRCRRPLTPQLERDASAGQVTPPRVRHHRSHEVKSRHGRRHVGRGGRARGLHCTMPESTDVCLRVVFGGGGGGVLLGSGGGRCLW